jgi:hypothetical protein
MLALHVEQRAELLLPAPQLALQPRTHRAAIKPLTLTVECTGVVREEAQFIR